MMSCRTFSILSTKHQYLPSATDQHQQLVSVHPYALVPLAEFHGIWQIAPPPSHQANIFCLK